MHREIRVLSIGIPYYISRKGNNDDISNQLRRR